MTSRPRANDWTNRPVLLAGCINAFDIRLRSELLDAQTKQGKHLNDARCREFEYAMIGAHARNTAYSGQRIRGFWHQFDVAVTREQVHHHENPFGADG